MRRSTTSRQRKPRPGPPSASTPPGESNRAASESDRWQRIAELESALAGYRDHVAAVNSTVARLREEQAEWVKVFEGIPAAYLVHDSAGYIHRMNRAAERLFGLTTGRRERPCLVHFLSEGNLVLWLEHIRQCASADEARHIELQLRTGVQKVSHVQILTWADPVALRPRQARWFYTLIFTAEPRRSSEAALAHAVRDYHRLIDMIEGIVWEADPDFTVTFVSRYAERLLGFSVSEWSQPGFWANRIYVQDRERVLTELNRALSRRRKELRLDYRVVANDRRLVWLHDSITAFERNGRPKLLGVAIDITEQRSAEEQLHQAHALLEQRVQERTAQLRRAVEQLETFSYSLSHDMRAPIRAMQGYAVLLRNALGEHATPQAVDFLRRISEGAERMDMLIQDVLKYSHLGRAPIELKPVPLEPLVSSILHDYPALGPSRAEVEILRPLPPVYGHEAFVGQALSNLLTNAVKFVPKGTKPQVRLRAEPAEEHGGKPGRWVRIWVEDNGLGIAPEDQTRIFRMFERVYPADQYEGTGMGLAIVQKAVEQLGGRVGVVSSPGQGSRFWIELPRA